MVIDQSFIVPASPRPISLALNIQFPFGMLKRLANKTTFEVLPGTIVAPGILLAAPALYVLVKGATPPIIDVTPVLLITVLMKLAPPPPSLLTKFNTLLLGAFRLIFKSASKGWVI